MLLLCCNIGGRAGQFHGSRGWDDDGEGTAGTTTGGGIRGSPYMTESKRITSKTCHLLLFDSRKIQATASPITQLIEVPRAMF